MDKKFVMGIAAMAALTLVSCSSDDLDSLSDNSSKNEAISFDGYLGRSAVAVNGSRGSVATVETLKNKGFGVFGYQNSSATHSDTESFVANLFNNQQVTYDNTKLKWTYSPLKFWPSDGHIDFLAYAPYGAGTFEDTYHLKFNVSETITDQKDLLWTNATSKITADITKKKVNFQFHHALSRLGYTVNLTGDYSSNPENKATFTLKKITLAGSSDGTKGAFYTSGTIDLSKQNNKEGLWSNQTGKQKFDWSSVDKPVTYVNPTDPTKKTVSNLDTEYLFVIPQDFSKDKTPGGSDVDELYVIVQYTIDYNDGTTPSVTNTVYKQIKKDFKQGKAYMLNLTLGLPIEFDVNVTGGIGAGIDGWGTDDGYNIGSNDTPWER